MYCSRWLYKPLIWAGCAFLISAVIGSFWVSFLLGGLLLSWLVGPEIIFIYDAANNRPVMVNTIPRSRREISFLLTTLFFAALAYAF